MSRYIRINTDVPGLDTLQDLIIEHKRLSSLLEDNATKIRLALCYSNIQVKVEDTADDSQRPV